MVPSRFPTSPRRIRARCPRDGGLLLLEQDVHGAYLTCLSCGFVLEERPDAVDGGHAAWWRAQPA